MKKTVSLVVPSIRPQNLLKFYTSVEKACKKNSFEIVIPSPYLLPNELLSKGNVKFLHTYANPTISFQMAALLCDAEYIYNTVDDGLVREGAIDSAIELFKTLSNKDSINMRYNEAVLDANTLEPFSPEVQKQNLLGHKDNPPYYWVAWSHGDLRLPGIMRHWKISPHFFMKFDYFYELGGFDCNFEYSNHCLHDLAFRVQANGGQVVESIEPAFEASHLPGKSGDHGPIVDAQLGPDLTRFNQIYSNPRAAFERIYLDYNDWRDKPDVWSRRFNPSNLQLQP